MKIKLVTPHLSIREFSEINVPDFTLITGLNGSGKSHLLSGIKAGRIIVDCTDDTTRMISLYDWTNFIPQDNLEPISGHALIHERNSLFDKFEREVQQQSARITRVASSAGLSGPILLHPARILCLTRSELQEILGNEERAIAAEQVIRNVAVETARDVLTSGEIRAHASRIEEIAKLLQRPVCALTRSELLRGDFLSLGAVNAFQQAFGRLFTAYRDLYLSNQTRLLQRTKGRTDVSALTDDEFRQRHGVPPWQVVNEALATAELDFQIDHPDEFEHTDYKPKLIKRSHQAEVRFEDLSSGEKVLLSLANCLFYASDQRQSVTYPKLLLLDEVDAPLHPAMTRVFLKTVTEIVVKKHGIKVIATTHSPSTVALAPEDSLYAMFSDRPGLHKTTKAQALNVITTGLPVLAISYEGRRQVFVESDTDSRIYNSLFQILRPALGSERSLDFVATGTRSTETGSETNTGCDNVIRIVNALAKAGNTSVYGLVDWDGKRSISQRVFVLAHERRDAIENVVLDPILVAGAIVKLDRAEAKKIGFAEDQTYSTFLEFEPARLQQVSDEVQRQVLQDIGPLKNPVEAWYFGGFSLKLANDYMRMDDHKLEARVLETFPVLQRVARGKGAALLEYIVHEVIPDRTGIVPMELIDALQWLLKQPSH